MPKFSIMQSKIAGYGAFANACIRAGDVVTTLNGTVYPVEEMVRLILGGVEGDGDQLGIDDGLYLDLDEPSRAFNHSCDPNCYIQNARTLRAMRDIEVGEELTYDYSTTMNDDKERIEAAGDKVWVCQCTCGSSRCRGVIDQFRSLPTDLRRYYLEHRYAPDFILRAFPA